MKLLIRYSRWNITATVLIFLAGSCAYYFLLRYLVISELDDVLYTEHQEIVAYVKEHQAVPEVVPTKDQYISYRQTGTVQPLQIHTINAMNVAEHEEDLFREMVFTINAGGKLYRVSVSKPMEETENLMKMIILVTIGMVALILAISYIINRRLLNSLWRPFYHTIEQVKKYKVADKNMPEFNDTDIDEFALLNQSILQMTSRVQKDYESLKAFTSHAAHEMQTPLAVIRTRLDMLMQHEQLLQHRATGIPDIEKAVHKLSKLYQALLLLTRVENRQFVLNDAVAVDEIVKDKFAELSDMLEAKDIRAELHLQPLNIVFHRQLTEIVIGNLLYNALRYNIPGGELIIHLEAGLLTVANTSALPALDVQRVFQRFYRHAEVREDGNGLGLSIVQQICDMAGFSAMYAYENDRHIFSVLFRQGRTGLN